MFQGLTVKARIIFLLSQMSRSARTNLPLWQARLALIL